MGLYHAVEALGTLTKYPDGNTTIGMGEDNVQMTYNLDGSQATRKDQRGVVMTYTYDNARRPSVEGATTIPGGVDHAIESIKRTYDTLGRAERITSYSGNDGTGTVLNEIKYAYGDHGLVTAVDQDHTDAVGSGTAHQTVSYAYDATVSSSVYTKGLRLDELGYPLVASAKLVHYYNGAGTADDRLRRLRYQKLYDGALTANDVHQTMRYEYNGTGRVVHVESYGAGALDIEREMNTAAGVYGTWDRFGRTLQQKWFRSSTSYVDVKHGYDYAGNRLWREDVVAAANSQDDDEFYTYEGLQRLKLFDRGNLTGTPPTGITGTPAKEQDWELDQLGNWANLLDKTSGTTDLDQDRAHNSVNEIDDDNTHADGPAVITTTTGTNWADPEYDAAGNMTTMPQIGNPASAHDAVYDAWNRLVEYDSGLGVPKYEYNGLNQLIVRTTLAPTYYYYNDRWQVIVEDNSLVSTNDALLAWHPYYIDALAVRFRENDRHAFLHDANFNVTVAYDINSSSGTYRQVVERYQYSPYGEVTFLDANFAVDSDQVSDILNNYLYTGRERDLNSKLQLNRHRWYHAGLGRWLTQDPIGYNDGTNLYVYVNDKPISHLDSQGLAGVVINPKDRCVRCTCKSRNGSHVWVKTVQCDMTSFDDKTYKDCCISGGACDPPNGYGIVQCWPAQGSRPG